MGLWSSKATCSKFLIINVHFYWMKKSDKVGFLHFPLQALQLLLLTLWPMRIWVIAFFTNQNTKCITFKYRFPLMAVVVLWDHALYSSNMHKDKPIKITIFCLEWAHTHNSNRESCLYWVKNNWMKDMKNEFTYLSYASSQVLYRNRCLTLLPREK